MGELVKQFGIDWKLLLAQMVNFGILLFVLHRFAYGPILNILRERRKKIEEGITAAEESKNKLAVIEKQGEELLSNARKEGLDIIKKSEVIGKEKQAQIIVEGEKKSEEILKTAKAVINEEKLKMKEAVYDESAEFLKIALARIVEKSPENIDNNLIQGTLRELKEI